MNGLIHSAHTLSMVNLGGYRYEFKPSNAEDTLVQSAMKKDFLNTILIKSCWYLLISPR